MKNTLFPYSVLLNLILLLLLGLLLLLPPQQPCHDYATVTVRHDTIYPTDKLTLAGSYVPIPKKKYIRSINTVGKGTLTDTSSVPAANCGSVFYYSDTFYQRNNYRAVVNDTVTGNHISGRSFWFVNLKPEVQTPIEKEKKEKVRLYLGADVTINAHYFNRWGIGPAALLTLPPGLALSYYYDVRNNAHTGGVFVLLRINRRS